MTRTTLRVWAILLGLVLMSCGQAAAADGNRVVVRLRDGGEVQGTLLVMTPDHVKLDPDGAVSLRTIDAAGIAAVVIVDTGEVIRYPLAGAALEHDAVQLREVAPKRRSDGFQPWVVLVQAGMTHPGGDYFRGFDGGAGFQGGLQYRFNTAESKSGQFFVGISYRHCSPSLASDTAYDDYGNLMAVDYDDVRISMLSFEVGRTTRAMQNDSYLYAIGGFTVVTTSASARLTDASGVELASSEDDDTQASLRMCGGGVVGLTTRLGLCVNIGLDLLIQAKDDHRSDYDDYDYYGQDRDNRELIGTVTVLDLGLVYEF